LDGAIVESFVLFIEAFSFFCRFDKRITAFAEEKFKRDGINVKTGSMVVKVAGKEFLLKK
jgi:NADH dehydrogenase FAD-containing subunit